MADLETTFNLVVRSSYTVWS